MSEKDYTEIKRLLASNDPEEIHQGLVQVRNIFPEVDREEARELVELVSALFYVDLLDHPDQVYVIDEAVSLVADFGEFVVPILLKNLDAGDMKAQLTIGHAMGRVGEAAIDPLLEAYCGDQDECRIFILYALGKIQSPEVIKAFDHALEAAESANDELRDTAVRALGNFVEHIPPEDLIEEDKQRLLDVIQENLAHTSAGVRSKAIRTYGKLARYGHLTADEKIKCRETCELILGADGQYDWDRAYIVRKEAQTALDCLDNDC